MSNDESADVVVVCCLAWVVISKRVENFQLGADGKATKAKYNLCMRIETDALIIAINNCGGVTIFDRSSSFSRAQRNSIRTDAAIQGNTWAFQSLHSISMKTFHFDQFISIIHFQSSNTKCCRRREHTAYNAKVIKYIKKNNIIH